MPEADVGDLDPRALLARLFQRVVARVDGTRLVAAAVDRDPVLTTASHVLAVGKVAFPMLSGLPSTGTGPGARRVLVIAPAPLFPSVLPAGVDAVAADHPDPSARSVAAGRAALRFVGSVADAGTGAAADSLDPGANVNRGHRLLVLLSGGASSLLCAPAGLAWEDKRDAIAAVARAGASIRELNVVRKHLSAIKGGQLALATRVPIAVRALSDVVGDDPATIGSGPFSGDPSTFAEARDIVARLGAALPATARARLERGARGGVAETPKPGDDALAHVDYRILAGPGRVVAEAQAAIAAEGLTSGALAMNTEDTVESIAEATLAQAGVQTGVRTGGLSVPAAYRILVGNGEPRVVLPDVLRQGRAGRGGRATHLALLVARGLAALPDDRRAGVAFLAAGTDDRDGDSDVSGAIVDGTTWARACALGLDPEAALRAFDSLAVLAATGDTIRGPGTSNLLDLHLLAGPSR